MKVFSGSLALFLVSLTTVQAVPAPMTEQLESLFKALPGVIDSQNNHVSSALNSKIHAANLPEVQMLEHGADVPVHRKSHRKTTSITGPDLDLDISLAQLNAREAEAKATTGRGVASISEVNEMWKKKMDDVDTSFKAKSVAFVPEVTTHDSSSLLKLENDLELAKINSLDSARETTVGRKHHPIDVVNAIWKDQISEDVNPLRTKKLTFSPASE